MKKRTKQAAALGCAAAALAVAAPAEASRPVPDGTAQRAQSAQSVRIRSDLDDIRIRNVAPVATQSPDPADIPLLPLGLGVVAVAAFAAGAVTHRRHGHRVQPV